MKCYNLSYQLEVKKWKVSFQVANSKVRVFLFPFWVTNSKLEKKIVLRVSTNSKLEKKLYFELVTRWLCSYFFCFWVTNSKLENKIFHFELLTRSLNFYFLKFSFLSSVFLLKLWWTELKSQLKVCQFLYGLQLQNDKKNNLRTSKLNKDLSHIKCFQCCLSIENYLETKWLRKMKQM